MPAREAVRMAYAYKVRPRWLRLRDHVRASFVGADPRVCIAFWLFGLINNVLYVVILSAALDLVGPDVPKGVVLLADIIPSFATKLIAPYFIHAVPYSVRVFIFTILSVLGMLIVAWSPSFTDGGNLASKIIGIVLASLSAGGGELSFVGLTHFYGPFSLAAWASGTGAAGLVGAGAYALATSAWRFSVHSTLFASAWLPFLLVVSYFFILPSSSSMQHLTAVAGEYQAVLSSERASDEAEEHGQPHGELQGLLGITLPWDESSKSEGMAEGPMWQDRLRMNLHRLKKLFFPFMLPLFLVYVSEYVINQGVAPTLLFPVYETPFLFYRSFYPTYNAIYQAGVFLSRSSTPFFRVHYLYLPSLLQVVNLVLLSMHAMFNFIPSVWIIFVIVFWEGLLGGLVYVNTFAEIGDRVPEEEREFSLGATTVSDSAGICVAGLISMGLEVFLCQFQIAHGRTYCREIL